jgi:hypothetical protein
MDYGKDIVGMKGEHPFFPMSDHQRIVGIGGLALPLEKVDLAWHAADVATGGKFHKLFPHLTHVTMKRLNLIAAEIGWPNFLQDFGKAITKRTGWRGVERLFHHKFEIQTVWVPRAVALAGLAVLLWGTQTWSNLKKGFSGNSSHAQPEHG